MSNEYFSADGTLIEAWASMKSFRPKDDQQSTESVPPWMTLQKSEATTRTRVRRSESQAPEEGQGTGSKALLGAHAIMENRNGLCIHINPHLSVGRTEAEIAIEQIDDLPERGFAVRTMRADKNYHSERFISGCRERGIKPHVAQVNGRNVERLTHEPVDELCDQPR